MNRIYLKKGFFLMTLQDYAARNNLCSIDMGVSLCNNYFACSKLDKDNVNIKLVWCVE